MEFLHWLFFEWLSCFFCG